jgi:hypothetical protein
MGSYVYVLESWIFIAAVISLPFIVPPSGLANAEGEFDDRTLSLQYPSIALSSQQTQIAAIIVKSTPGATLT